MKNSKWNQNLLLNKPVAQLGQIDENKYQPDSFTPLFDDYNVR